MSSPAAATGYRPYVASAMIFAENNYRNAIGLPSVIPAEQGIVALKHSTFMTFVVDGTANPLDAWEAHYGMVHSDYI